MNTKQLQYAITLAQVRNFSQVAQKMHITQPALSKQIMSLEKELDIKLFDRNTTPLTLTPAGEDFIRQAKELVYREEQLRQSMQRYSSGEAGNLVIGVSPFRSLYLIPPMIRALREKYPGIRVVLQENKSGQLRKDAAEGKYDFAIVNLPVDEDLLDVIPLEPDTLVLAVPNRMAAGLSADPGKELPVVDFSQCSQLPFVVVNSAQEMGQLFDKLCAGAGFHPNIVAEVVGLSTAWAMVQSGIGAALLPLQFVKASSLEGQLTLFSLRDLHYSRCPVVVTKRGKPLSECAHYAIELLTR